jgi:uncharacterized alpha-E superfamily protein
MLDIPSAGEQQWKPLVMVTGDSKLFKKSYGLPTQKNVMHFLTFAPDYPNSILSCVQAARENARTVREVISSEMWEHINGFYLMVKQASEGIYALDNPHEFYAEVKRQSHLFTGFTYDTMSHGEGWHFCMLGRLLERADKTSRILDVKYFILLPQVDYVGSPYDKLQWAAVLKSASALEMYRKRYHRIDPRQVANFLIFDIEFPRSIHYCLVEAEESLHTITGSPSSTFQNAAERALGRLRTDLDYSDIEDVFETGTHQFLDDFQLKLNHVGDSICAAFFATRPTPGAQKLQEQS